jgi:hypothetical protein
VNPAGRAPTAAEPPPADLTTYLTTHLAAGPGRPVAGPRPTRARPAPDPHRRPALPYARPLR